MSLSVELFADHVIRSGLLSKEEVWSFIEHIPDGERPTDGEMLAREMVEQQLLTQYQSDLLQKGMTAGWILGDYMILDMLGKGGMGIVFKAQHRRLNRTVALKVLPPAAMACEQTVARFKQEVQAIGKLSHPNMVVAHDARIDGGVHFLVMEYVLGWDLAKLVQKRGPLPISQAVAVVTQTAIGLAYAHRHGVVHRDIKPQNLMIARDGTVKIFDLGLARLATDDLGGSRRSHSERLTRAGMMLGTVAFMAPEQSIDSREADRRSDIYSLGCTFFYLITGQAPYGLENTPQVVIAHREQAVPSPRPLRPEISKELDAIVRKMMAKDPDERYQSMEELVGVLEELHLSSEGETIPSDVAIGTQSDAEFFMTWLGWRDQATRIASRNDSEVPTVVKGGSTTGRRKDVPGVQPRPITPPSSEARTRDAFATATPGSALPGSAERPKVNNVVLYAATGLAVVLIVVGAFISQPWAGFIKQAPGTLVLEVTPSDCVVQIFDLSNRLELSEHVKQTNAVFGLRAGRWNVTVIKPGYIDHRQELTIQPNGTEKLRIELSPEDDAAPAGTSAGTGTSPAATTTTD